MMNNKQDFKLNFKNSDQHEVLELQLQLEEMNSRELNYHSLYEQASDAIMITDFKGNFLDVNLSFCKMFGYEKEELVKMNASQVIDKQELKERPIRFDLLAGGQHVINQRTMVHKNGELIYVEANVKKFGENMIMAIARDVTELRKAQRKIEISESLFRGAFEFSANGMAVVSLEGKWLKVNRELLNILGYREEEMLKLSFMDLTHPDDLISDRQFIDQALKGILDTYRVEKRYLHKNGKFIWVRINVSLIKDDSSMPLYFVSQVENISERRRTEKELSDSESRYRSLVENAPEALVVLDLEANKFVSVSESAIRLFKRSKEELLKIGVKELSPAYQPDGNRSDEKAYENIMEAVNGGMPSFEWTHCDNMGNEIPCEVRLARLPSEDRILIRGSVIDISERKKAEIDRQNITKDLIQRNKDLEQFAYIVSHNLRAPVANIIGLTTELSDNSHDEDLKGYFTKELENCAGKLDSIIKDLNYILQIKQNVVECKEEINFQELVDNVKSVIGILLEKEEVQIKTDFDSVKSTNGLKSYIYSVFYNLILNSIKYKHPDRKPVLEITSYRTAGNKTQLTFKDNGSGIDLDKYGEQVFGLYKRFHPQIEGKGMGLFMVKAQVETLGGKISIRSKLNSGTEFIIEF